MTEKNLKFFVSEKAEVNDEEKSIVHYCTTNALDRDSEIVLASGIDVTNYRKNPIVLADHNSWSVRNVVGKNLWTKVDSVGLLCKTQFSDTEFGNEVFRLYKDGFLTSWSIGFIPKTWESNEAGNRVITESELLEYSCVTIPANPEAVSLSFIKGIRSPELKSHYINDFLLTEWDSELTKIKSDLTELNSEVKLKELINEIVNPIRIELESKLAELHLLEYKQNLANIIDSAVRTKLG